jgi:hypothetical protein
MTVFADHILAEIKQGAENAVAVVTSSFETLRSSG